MQQKYLNSIYNKPSILKLVKLRLGFFMVMCLFFVVNAFGQRTASVSGNWDSTTTWGGSSVPTATDAVTINPSVTVTVNVANATCSSVQIGNNAGTAVLQFNALSQLTVSGVVTVGQFSANNNRFGQLTMTLGGKLICAGLAVAFSNAGNTFTRGSGTIELTATNTLPASTFTTFNNLIISGGITTLAANINSTVSTGSLTVNAGAALNLSTFTFGATTPIPFTTLQCGGASTGGTISGTGTLTLGGNVTVTDNTGGTAGATISCPVALGTTRTFTVADDGTSANDLTMSGVISGTAGVTKVGAGTLYLSASNTYNGAVTISAGRLLANTVANANSNSSLGTGGGTAAISIGGSGTLAYNGSGHSSSRAITLTSTGATIDASGTGALTLSGGITANTFNIVLTGTGTATQSGVIATTSGTLTKNGSGIWTLSGNNSYTGMTLISAGTLKLGNTTALGASSVTTVSSGAVLDLNGTTLSSARPLTLNGTGLTSSPAGALTNTGVTASYSGAITLVSASTITATSSGTLTCSGAVAGPFGLTLDGSAGTGTMSGVISAPTSLTKNGAGTWTLSGNNTYTGTTTINEGRLSVGTIVVSGSASNLGNATSAVVLGGSATSGALSYTGPTAIFTRGFTVNAGGGSIINTTANLLTIGTGGIATTSAVTLSNTSTGGTTISSVISSTGSLIINNSGTAVTTLSGTNTYSGGTTLSAGKLTIGNTAALGSTSGAFSISGTGIATLSFNVTVGSLTIGGLGTASGTWGSSTPSAKYTSSVFVSTGLVTVGTDTRTTPTVTPTVGTYIYSGAAQGPNSVTNTGTATSYTYSYEGVSPTDFPASNTSPIKAGTYTVKVTVNENGNYKSVTSSAEPFTINKKELTITGLSVGDKTFDTTDFAILDDTLVDLVGVVSSDDVALDFSNDIGTFVSSNVGTGIAVVVDGFELFGMDKENYSLILPTTLTANITAQPLTIFANNNNKCSNTTLTFAGTEFTTNAEDSGFIDSGLSISKVTLTSTGVNSTAGAGSYPIVVSNALGTGLTNYLISYVPGTLTVITPLVTTGTTICPGGSGVITSSTCVSSSIPSGIKYAGAGANSVGIGTDAWTNTSNIMTNNNSSASVTLTGNGRVSNYLVSTNHSFAIPSIAIIQGIKVVLGKNSINNGGGARPRIADNEVKLVKAGVIGSTNRAVGTNWPQREQAFTYGSTTDNWGSTWTPTDINNANFGVAISVRNQSARTRTFTAYVDYVTIEVTYGFPGDINWYTVSSGGTAIGSGSPFNPVGVAGSPLMDTNTPGTTTFYAECSSSPGCRTATNFVVNTYPTAPIATNSSKTYTGIANTTSISVTPQTSQTFDWYQDATGGSPLRTGNTTYTPTAVNAGTYTFYAVSRNTTSGCTSATRTPVTLTINKAPLTIKANNQTVIYGTAVATVTGAGTFTVSGFVNGETASVISGTATYTTTYTATTNAGTLGVTITPSVSGLTATNYSFSTVNNGTITISNASPIVTPVIGSYTYTGMPLGPNTATNTGSGVYYTYSYVGVSGTVYTASATPPTAAGSYTVTATVAAHGNYSAASSVPTVFTISKATLTITANNQVVSYGVSVSLVTGAGSYAATGFINGETTSVISGAVTYTTTYTTTTAFGTAGVTITPNVAGLSAANYSFIGANGTIDINTKITPTISVTEATYTYTGFPQGPNTATNSGTGSSYTYSYSGSGSTVYGPSNIQPTNAGTYTVKATVAASNDGVYNAVTSAETAFTIDKAALKITAQDQSKCFGASVVFFGDEFLSAGLQNLDIVNKVSLSSTASATAVLAGTYAITPFAAVGTGLSNYTITYVDGTFTVISAPAPSLSVTPSSVPTVCSGTAVAIVATVSGGSPNKVFTGVNNTRKNIPNNSLGSYTYSTVSLSDATLSTVSATSIISVKFSISHRSVGELDVFLVDPSGTRGMLLTANNGGNGNDYFNTIISTSVTTIIGGNNAPFTNTYAPEGNLTSVPVLATQSGNGSYSSATIGAAALNGATINGNWSLRVFDTNGNTTGTLDNWTLTITNPGVYTSTLIGPPANETITYSGANNSSVAISLKPSPGVNNYYVETTDAIGCSNISSAIVATVNTAPAITVQPSTPAVVCSGAGTRMISVTATGTALTYTWRKSGVPVTNGAVISGQGTANLTFTNPIATDAGSYDVVIGGTCSPNVISSPVTLTVSPIPTAGLTSSDADNTFCAGTSVTFTATGGTNYNFRVAGSSVQNGPTATYTTTALTNGQVVDVIVTNASGCVATSSGITNTVNALPTAGLSSSDADNTFCAGTSVTFTATGGTNYNFKVTGISVQNSITNTYTATALTNGQIVTVDVTNASGCVAASSGITNTVNALPIAGLSSSDSDNTFCAGTSVTFTATGGTNYDFRVAGSSVQNGPTATYTTTALTNGQVVDVIVTNASGCVATSSGITNIVNQLPIITTQPIHQLDCEGSIVTFNVVASGTALSYVWQRKLPTDASFITIPVETNVSYPTPDKIRLQNTGSSLSPSGTQYQVIVTSSSSCGVTSTPATLSVNEITGISPISTNVTQCYGTNYSYTVSTSTPPPGLVVSYQWKSSVASGVWIDVVDGTHFSGAKTATLNIINGTPAESAEYKVLVIFTSSGANCNVTTALTRKITFLPLLTTPVVTITQPNCFTATGTIAVTVQSVSDNYSFDNGVSYQASNVKSGLNTGNYNVIIKNSLGCVSVTTATVINPQPVTPVQPVLSAVNQPTYKVSTGSFTITNYNSSYAYTVSPNIGVILSESTVTAPPGNYVVIAILGSCSSIASANVAILPLVTKIWNGIDWFSNDVLTTAPTINDLVVINGNYNTSTNGDINACNVTINTGNTLTITPGGNVIIQNDLTVNADATLDVLDKGSLVMVDDLGKVTNTGKTYVRRSTTPFKRYDYVYWSSPVTTTSIADTFQNKGWNTNRAYGYIPGSGWSFASTMSPGKGYIIMVPTPTSGPGTDTSNVVFSGEVNNGDKIKITGVIANSSYLLGNPYPSAIDADIFLEENKEVLDGTLYFWTHNTAIQLASNITNGTAGSGAYAFTSDDYATYNTTGGVATSEAKSSGMNISIPTGKIASGQGFFGSSKPILGTIKEIVYNNSMRLIGTLDSGKGVNEQFFKTSNTKSKTAIVFKKHRIWLDLKNSQGAFKQTLVGYITGATNDYDSRFDGESFDGNQFVDFYSVNQNKNLTIQGRALPFDEKDTVALGFKTTIEGSFTIKIGQVDGLLIDQAIYLEDKLTNTLFDLKTGNYTFTTAKGIFNDRFVLRYTNDKSLGVNEIDSENGILVFYSNNYKTLIIKNNVDSLVNSVSLFNITGQNIDNWDVKDGWQSNIQIPIKNISSGVYIVKVKTTKGEISNKIIIK